MTSILKFGVRCRLVSSESHGGELVRESMRFNGCWFHLNAVSGHGGDDVVAVADDARIFEVLM